MVFVYVLVGEDYGLVGNKVWIVVFFYLIGKINVWYYWKLMDNFVFVGDCQGVFIIEI